jgi:hypothetical protein
MAHQLCDQSLAQRVRALGLALHRHCDALGIRVVPTAPFGELADEEPLSVLLKIEGGRIYPLVGGRVAGNLVAVIQDAQPRYARLASLSIQVRDNVDASYFGSEGRRQLRALDILKSCEGASVHIMKRAGPDGSLGRAIEDHAHFALCRIDLGNEPQLAERRLRRRLQQLLGGDEQLAVDLDERHLFAPIILVGHAQRQPLTVEHRSRALVLLARARAIALHERDIEAASADRGFDR